MKKRIRWIALAALVLVIATAVWAVALRSRGSAPEIETVAVRRDTISSIVSASGDLATVASKDIAPQISGNIDELAVTDGQKVRAGQLLARLDARPYRVAVSAAQAAYQAAVAQKDQIIRSAPRSSELAAAEQAVRQARYAYRLARSRWRRANIYQKPDKKLDMDAKLQALLVAKAARDKLLVASSLGEQLASANSAIDNAARAFRKAEVDLSATAIFSPSPGTLIFKSSTNPTTGETSKVSEGSGAQAGSAIFAVANLSAMEFVADVDETDISKVRTNLKATVTLDAYPEAEIKGKVVQVAPSAVTAKSGGTSFPVKIRLPKTKFSLRIGMNGSADIIRAQAADVLVLPYEAVTTKDGQPSVFVIEVGTAKLRPVVLGLSTDTYYEIEKGVSDGEVVARTKVASLKDGQAVTVK